MSHNIVVIADGQVVPPDHLIFMSGDSNWVVTHSEAVKMGVLPRAKRQGHIGHHVAGSPFIDEVAITPREEIPPLKLLERDRFYREEFNKPWQQRRKKGGFRNY